MSESRSKTFDEYMRAYGEIHQHPINKACHMIGIPMIVASLPLIPTVPPVGVPMFGAGWAFQFVGHYFEGKAPQFTSSPMNLAIGPLWAALEWIELLTGKRLYQVPPTSVTPPVHSVSHDTPERPVATVAHAIQATTAA